MLQFVYLISNFFQSTLPLYRRRINIMFILLPELPNSIAGLRLNTVLSIYFFTYNSCWYNHAV